MNIVILEKTPDKIMQTTIKIIDRLVIDEILDELVFYCRNVLNNSNSLEKSLELSIENLRITSRIESLYNIEASKLGEKQPIKLSENKKEELIRKIKKNAKKRLYSITRNSKETFLSQSVKKTSVFNSILGSLLVIIPIIIVIALFYFQILT